MKYLYCTWCILLLYNISFGQENTNEVLRPKKTIVKFSVLSHLEGEPVVQVGVERIFKSTFSFQQQLGYVYRSPVSALWGLRSRSEMRSYFSATAERAQGYVAAEVLYKFLQNYGTREFWRADGGYQQRIDFRANRNTIGFMPKIGLTNNIFKSNFAIDFAFGIGVKATYYKSNVPGDASLNFNNEIFSDPTFFNRNLRNNGFEVLPNILLSLQIGFVAN